MSSPLDGTNEFDESAFRSPQTSIHAQACERCWRRKQRCDRRLPSCTPCAARNLSCTQRSLPRTHRHDGDSFIAVLEQRIYDLKRNAPQTEAASTAPSKQADATSSVGTKSLDSSHESPAVASMPTPATQASRDFEPLTLHTMWEGESKAIDSQKRSIHFVILDAAVRGSRGHDYNLNVTGALIDGDTGDATKATQNEFRRILSFTSSGCFDQYLQLCDAMAAFVASDTASAMYKLVAEAMHSDNSADIFTEKPASATLVYLMAAASIYYSGDQACPDPSVPHLVDAAVRGMRMITFGVEPYRMAQCLAMFTCLSTFHPAYGSTWYLVGLLAVECLSLGVHSYEQQSIMPQKERLEMNRFFWAVFIMDRSVSLAMGRPFAIPHSEISIEPPTADETDGAHQDALLCEGVVHAFLMTEFRLNPIRAYNFHATNYREFLHRYPIHDLAEEPDAESSRLWTHKYRRRLRCRGWIELAVIMSQDVACEVEVPDSAAIDDILQFLQILRAYNEVHGLSISTVEAHDAFAGVIACAYFAAHGLAADAASYLSRLWNSLAAVASAFAIAADILTLVSRRFKAMLPLRQVLRDFMAASGSGARDSAQFPIDGDAVDTILTDLLRPCQYSLPRYVCRLMHRTLEKATAAGRSQSDNQDG